MRLQCVLRLLVSGIHRTAGRVSRRILEQEADFEVVGEAANGRQAVSQARELKAARYSPHRGPPAQSGRNGGH